METCAVARRMSALILVITMSVIGMPLPAGAAGEEDVEVAWHRALTFNGRPLSQSAGATDRAWRPGPMERLTVQPDGHIDGFGVTKEAQEVLSSFDALQSILKVGQEVKVRDEWRTIQGRLESLSADELVISTRLGWFRGRADLTFRENVIKRVDIADSTWNGFAIGAAAGFGGMFVHYRSCSPSCGNLWGLPWFFIAPFAPFVGMWVDALMTEPIYQRPNAPRVTISPLLGRERVGLSARVQF